MGNPPRRAARLVMRHLPQTSGKTAGVNRAKCATGAGFGRVSQAGRTWCGSACNRRPFPEPVIELFIPADGGSQTEIECPIARGTPHAGTFGRVRRESGQCVGEVAGGSPGHDKTLLFVAHDARMIACVCRADGQAACHRFQQRVADALEEACA